MQPLSHPWPQLDLFGAREPEGFPEPIPELEPAEQFADRLRQRIAYSTPRRRQGVAHRSAMPPGELSQHCVSLRTRAEAGDERAILTLLALLVGISSKQAPLIPLTAKDPSTVTLDIATGCVRIDYASVFMGNAAGVLDNETAFPASHVLLKPLPAFLAQIIQAAHRLKPSARSVGDLFGTENYNDGEPLDSNPHGRLRATAARMSSGLPVFVLRLGIDRYEAALVTGDFSLVPRSRFFYIRSNTGRFLEACRQTFAVLGWGEPVPLEPILPFGSLVVPLPDTVRQLHGLHAKRLAASYPTRRSDIDMLIAHHNDFMIAAGWHLSFLVGSRAMRRLDFMADRCIPGMTFMEYADKRSGPFQRLQPVLLCAAAQRQVAAVWDHLVRFCARLYRCDFDPDIAWFQHLKALTRQKRVALLFLIRNGRVIPLSTAHCQLGIDNSLRLAPNAGRHFWQTTLLDRGVPSEAIDVWARHANGGMEPMTSTSVTSLDAVHQQVCRIQDAVVRELGLTVFRGLDR